MIAKSFQELVDKIKELSGLDVWVSYSDPDTAGAYDEVTDGFWVVLNAVEKTPACKEAEKRFNTIIEEKLWTTFG